MTVSLVAALHKSEESRLKRFFERKLGNPVDAADATQETYLRLLNALSRTTIENPAAYLFQVAHSVASTTRSKRRRELRLFDSDSDQLAHVADAGARVEEQVAARQSLRRLAAAIDELPPRCREAFLLSRFDGLTNGDVAIKLGISRNMVEKHIIRALLHCRRCCLDLFF